MNRFVWVACVAISVLPNLCVAHQGPDPIAHWSFSNRTTSRQFVQARLGPDLKLPESARLVADPSGPALDLAGSGEGMIRSDRFDGHESAFPKEALTVAAWVAIDEAEERGGIVALASDSPDAENVASGWSLGFDDTTFTLTLSTDAAGGARTTTLKGATPYAKGKWFHVVGVYDGERAQLFVNGVLDAESEPLEGGLVAPRAPFVAVGSTGDPSRPSLRGKLRDVSVYDIAAKPAWVQHAFEDLKQLVAMKRDSRADALSMVVEPYLQFGTQDGMTVMWQTSLPGTSVVRFGETADCDRSVSGAEAEIHEVRIEGLEPATQYFYRVETEDADGQSIGSRVSTFSTAVP